MTTLLVLGTSDSDGSQLQARELAWPWLIAAQMGSEEAPVEVVHKRFYATAPGALPYLERQLANERPEIVILSITLYAFSVKTVANRLRHVAGNRVGDWAEQRFRWFDAKTGSRGRRAERGASALARVNRTAHRVARSVIGTASEASAQQVLDAYTKAIERLAREEEIQVVVIGSFPFTEAIEARNPKAGPVRESFNRRISAVCRKHHVEWVDPEFISSLDVEALYSDSLHFTEAAHRLVAAEVGQTLTRT